MESLVTLLGALNTMSPLGIIALLGVVILLMVHKKGPIQTLANNHLSHVQDSLDQIAKTSEQQVELLVDISKDISWVKGRLDNRPIEPPYYKLVSSKDETK